MPKFATRPCPDPYTLPEDALCLTADGWTPTGLEVLTINMEACTTVVQVLEHIWMHHGGMLGGGGTLVFLVKDQTNPMSPKGYIVFEPFPECPTCKGKGMESWSEPFSQTTAAVCPDCLGDGFQKPG